MNALNTKIPTILSTEQVIVNHISGNAAACFLYFAVGQTVEIVVSNSIGCGFDVILMTMRANILLNPSGFPTLRTLGVETISIVHHLNHLW